MKNRLIAIGAVAAIVIGISLTVPNTFAQSGSTPHTDLIEKIASTFNLDKAKVAAVFDQERTEHQTEQQANVEEKLTQLVKGGKISEAQKQLILQKHQQMQDSRQEQMENKKSMTIDERKAAMEKQREEMQNWAKENGIDVQYLFPMTGKMKGHWK